MNIEPFIIENAGNTCYIDSLLMALFFQPSSIDKLLSTDVKDALIIYLQEYIKEKFVSYIRNNKSILSDDIEMLRTLCFQIGWKNNNLNEFYDQQDVNEFYIFITSLFENEQIILNKNIVSEDIEIKINDRENIPFIPLSLQENINNDTIKNMLHRWLYDNVQEYNGKNRLCSYNIVNYPLILALSINRFNNTENRITTNVIIQKKLNLNYEEWVFHSAVCHVGETLKHGHYYSLIRNGDDRWFLFDDLQTPCIKECKMDDKDVTDKIKKECVFLIYKKLVI